ncbi:MULTISPECIES: DUF6584 family protein [Streptomyces]|uniref:Tetratricopeptide repeat protein n=1 Tax=Streptomyces tsukubensis (strain DSM 42081 / NBRC 108919 / NRRL 18488 / 9993) TaxID=1114943 RepID=I2N4G4_STRT9|nr:MULTISPECIES: DUF6584 family protein [Streptomyces]AZK95986.1 hypothetical protein B7R87_20530 [Streptomyces tsukubensis]EIF91911.1 hypothetical protein [Streptomyces tsukubensis NRRL18488]MYS65088.1 hypothetical protein [Streptomyces sp. SID5473]QKM71586.1 hypothetical protein STSU_013250 [Streptomyces tsukubensis NRRL18488]TAI44392.1 hypothetical protein EWI31_13045 [Streptomyces tsukubensis]
MPLEATLARVDADLAAGRIPVARQRLRGLVSSFPADPALRRRLAEVYRLYGEPAEAGRWMYLAADRDAAETAAFEKRYDTPLRRMRALAWRGPESAAGSAFAEEQLAAVRTACSEALGRPAHWDFLPEHGNEQGAEEPTEGPGSKIAGVLIGAGCLVGVLAFLSVWVIGVVALFD